MSNYPITVEERSQVQAVEEKLQMQWLLARAEQRPRDCREQPHCWVNCGIAAWSRRDHCCLGCRGVPTLKLQNAEGRVIS